MELPRRVIRVAAAVLGAGAAACGAYAALAWRNYGRTSGPATAENVGLLDRFMPAWEVVERHQIRVRAPAEVTLAAARGMNVFQQPLVRAVVKARELLLGARSEDRRLPRGLLAQALALGWGLLDEAPGREIVVGAVTRPWEPDVTFRAVAPEAFATFDEPGYVKIAWTLRAEPVGAAESIFRTETRAIATDAGARRKFRRYWSLLSPGIILIRWVSLQAVKADAERLARARARLDW